MPTAFTLWRWSRAALPQKAGLQAGDRIVSVDGTEIASKDDLGTLMQKHAAGDTLSITIARDGQMQTVNVTLGEKTASNS